MAPRYDPAVAPSPWVRSPGRPNGCRPAPAARSPLVKKAARPGRPPAARRALRGRGQDQAGGRLRLVDSHVVPGPGRQHQVGGREPGVEAPGQPAVQVRVGRAGDEPQRAPEGAPGAEPVRPGEDRPQQVSGGRTAGGARRAAPAPHF
jgi:hypothetical protein